MIDFFTNCLNKFKTYLKKKISDISQTKVFQRIYKFIDVIQVKVNFASNMKKQIIIYITNELVRVLPERIVYISADGNYSTMVLHDKTEHLFTFNLSHFQKLIEQQLKEDACRFIRIGKSLIINRDYIYRINLAKQQLVMSINIVTIDDERLYLSY